MKKKERRRMRHDKIIGTACRNIEDLARARRDSKYGIMKMLAVLKTDPKKEEKDA